MDKQKSWSIAEIWNNSIGRPDRPLKVRDYIYATELGKAPIDVWLAMKATPYSNVPNDRSKRKFEAGDIWEWVVEIVLKRAGILIDKQVPVRFGLPGQLEVSGRLDHIAGGKPDWEKAKKEIDEMGLPDFIKNKADNVVNFFAKKYPDGLKEIVLDVKSASSFMFDVYERTDIGSDNHELQIYHYLAGTDYDEGHLVYVCRDDVRMFEVGIFKDTQRVKELYQKRIEYLTDCVKANRQPELEPMIVFDELLGKFKDNYKVKYSNYLTMLYGFKEPSDYEDKFKPIIQRWNRVLGRIVRGDKMTDNNKGALEEIRKEFGNFDEIIKTAKEKNQIPEDDKKDEVSVVGA